MVPDPIAPSQRWAGLQEFRYNLCLMTIVLSTRVLLCLHCLHFKMLCRFTVQCRYSSYCCCHILYLYFLCLILVQRYNKIGKHQNILPKNLQIFFRFHLAADSRQGTKGKVTFAPFQVSRKTSKTENNCEKIWKLRKNLLGEFEETISIVFD